MRVLRKQIDTFAYRKLRGKFAYRPFYDHASPLPSVNNIDSVCFKMRHLSASRILTRSRKLFVLLSPRPFATCVNFYITSAYRIRNDDTLQALIKDKTRGRYRSSFRNSVKKWTGKYFIFVKRSL